MNESIQLPALIDRAAKRLFEARSSAEVLEARAAAQAAHHYAKLVKASNETKADCVHMIVRAEMRMADEVDRAQEKGEVRIQKDNQHVRTSDKHSLEDIGINRQRLNEWRTVRDAGEEVVSEVIQNALSEGRAPTNSEILKASKEIRAERAEISRDRRIKNIAEISKGNTELNTGQRYPIIYADPPWQYENPPMGGVNRSIENHYPTMTLEEICALPVSEIASDDCLLYLWATAPKLQECMSVIDAWGFSYRTCFVWVKDKIGMGYHARNQHELLLVAKKGEIPPPPTSARVSSVIKGKRTEHSKKPEEFYELIESMYPELPKIELFSRNKREGWKNWGNQSDGT